MSIYFTLFTYVEYMQLFYLVVRDNTLIVGFVIINSVFCAYFISFSYKDL